MREEREEGRERGESLILVAFQRGLSFEVEGVALRQRDVKATVVHRICHSLVTNLFLFLLLSSPSLRHTKAKSRGLPELNRLEISHRNLLGDPRMRCVWCAEHEIV